jgi:hypothetical protein
MFKQFEESTIVLLKEFEDDSRPVYLRFQPTSGIRSHDYGVESLKVSLFDPKIFFED